MKKDIPEIDALLDGINDPDAVLTPTAPISSQPEVIKESEVNDPVPTIMSADNVNTDSAEQYWHYFMKHLSESDLRNEKDDRLVCKLDRDLADSLDDCDISNRSRSDLVNAIIRTFFGMFMPKLIQYRREKKSLFRHYINS